MKKLLKIKYFRWSLLLIGFALMLNSCGIYSFTGADTGDAETFQVNQFRNMADLIEPGIDREFTLQLQDLIQSQTSLGLTNNGGDLIYEGEITRYYISPMTATKNSTAAQNRLTIGIKVRFTNKLAPEKDFEKEFSFYYDYPGNQQLTGSTLDAALEAIYEHITQDVFNESLTNW